MDYLNFIKYLQEESRKKINKSERFFKEVEELCRRDNLYINYYNIFYIEKKSKEEVLEEYIKFINLYRDPCAKHIVVEEENKFYLFLQICGFFLCICPCLIICCKSLDVK
jgi:CO dehydrogenase/acetyl-CoA synthase beta subunit